MMTKGKYKEAVCALESLLNHWDKLEFLPHSVIAPLTVHCIGGYLDNEYGLLQILDLAKLVYESGHSEIQAR